MKLELQGRTAYAYTGGKAFDAQSPCVVLVHGALNDHSVWGLQSRYMAHHGHRVLAVDLPGHGRSDGPALASVEAMADWVVALLDELQVPRATIVGHSMGSLIGLETAARLGERADGLVMVGTAYPMTVSPVLLDGSRDDPPRAMALDNVFAHSTIAAKPSAPGPGSWLHGSAMALTRRMQGNYAQRHKGASLFHIDFSACNAYAGAEAAAARVRCPVRLVLGARDQMTLPRMAANLAQMLKAEVLHLPAGHSLMTEAPDGVLNAVWTFLHKKKEAAV